VRPGARTGPRVRAVEVTAPGAAARTWPFFDLVVRAPGLELRYASDDLLEELAVLHAAGLVEPGSEPFDGDATFYEPGPGTLRWLRGQWSARARTSPEWWVLVFAVVVGGRAVGAQEMTGIFFDKVRTVSSFSWLAPDARGRGLGKEMRAAVLQLAFAGLGAERAESEAFEDNAASQAVSRALGYELNGSTVAPRPSGAAPMSRFLLRREKWLRTQRRDDIEILGLSPCLPLLGLSGEVGAQR
jgi:RimJ/RimL family protein N-acetyltransferase